MWIMAALTAKEVSYDIHLAENSTTGNITLAESITSGTIGLGTGSSRTGSISIGNAAVAGGAVSISAGTGGSSTLTLQGTNGIALTSAASVSGLLSTTAGITNTNTVITSTPGINFGDATLSDFVTGTFTPSLSFAGTASVTTNSATGKYTRIGNIVFIFAFFDVSLFTGTATNTYMDDLPYTASGRTYLSMDVSICDAFGYSAASSVERRSCRVIPSSTSCEFEREDFATTGTLPIVSGNWNSGTNRTIQVSGWYFI